MPQHKEVLIIGGGMTGLTSAYILAKSGVKVTLIEASPTLGGIVGTYKVGGQFLEYFYHHYFTHDAELKWLCEELDITHKMVFKKTSMGIFRNGKIYNFNSGIDLLKFSPMKLTSKVRFGITSIFLGRFADWRKFEHVSALHWFEKYAGKQATECIWAPLLNIKFGDYASEVPLSWMIGRLSQRMRSRSKGEELLGYFDGGFKTLVDALEKKLKELGVELIPECKVLDVVLNDSSIAYLETAKGKLEADNYLFTIPAPEASKLTKQALHGDYFSALCVILELAKPLSAVYWLNVADSDYPFGGIIEHTNFIDPANYNGKHIAYLSRYFANTNTLASMSNDAIAKYMIPYLTKIYPQFKESDVLKYSVFKTRYAAPMITLNYSKKISACKTHLTNMYAINMTHLYPDERSCNNSISIAKAACDAMGYNTTFVPKGNSLAGVVCTTD